MPPAEVLAKDNIIYQDISLLTIISLQVAEICRQKTSAVLLAGFYHTEFYHDKSQTTHKDIWFFVQEEGFSCKLENTKPSITSEQYKVIQINRWR